MDTAQPQVRPFSDADADAWETYVRAQPAATVFHRLPWSRAVQEAYSHRPIHLTAWAGERLVGVLPLFCVNSLLAGRILVSIPYATYGGIVADNDHVAAALLEAAQLRCRELRARYVELRHRDPSGLDLPVIDRYDTFRKELPERPEDVIGWLPRKTRTAVRKGLQLLGDDAVVFGPEWLDVIYRLYAINLRRLGSPNYSQALFRALARGYGDDCVCTVLRNAGRPIAGVVSFVWRDEIVPYFSGTLDEAMPKRASNVMYVRLMEYAVRRGLRRFDFNRTRRDNPGPYDFKRHHGFEPSPLHYQVYLDGDRQLPNLSPSNRKFALAIRVWQRLPLWLTRCAGARVAKWVP